MTGRANAAAWSSDCRTARPGDSMPPAVQFGPEERPIVFVHGGQVFVGRLHAARSVARAWPPNRPPEPRPQRVVAHLGQAVKLVEQFFDGQHDGRALLLLKGGDGVGSAVRPRRSRRSQAARSRPGPPPDRNRGSAATTRCRAIVPPAADFVDQHAGGQRGPGHAGHFRGRRAAAAAAENSAAARIECKYAGRPRRGSSTRPSAPRKVRILIASKRSAARSSRRFDWRTGR